MKEQIQDDLSHQDLRQTEDLCILLYHEAKLIQFKTRYKTQNVYWSILQYLYLTKTVTKKHARIIALGCSENGLMVPKTIYELAKEDGFVPRKMYGIRIGSMSYWGTRGVGLQRPLRLDLLPSSFPVQSVRRSGAVFPASR